LYKK